ncbi:MAG: SpoIIE family protein phosphatase [Phycisphaerales bacterium]|nr:SpoIIE family protein phosphatase [Phycisphaerales bacterium]
MNDEIIEKGVGLLLPLLDLLPDYFYVIDSDMRMVYANKTAADYFRLSKEEIVGREWQTIEPNQTVARAVVELGRQIMTDGRPRVSDGEPYPEPDGTTSYYRRYDIPFHHPQTGELMLLGLAQEVTAQVERERQERRIAVMDREMQIARDIQRSLKPQVLDADWIGLVGRSEPAAYAGGDFYDWLIDESGAVTVMLGDVSGHGVGPAMVAAECRAFWRVLAPSLPLRDAILKMNRLMLDDLPGGRFVTMAAARFLPNGTLEIFSAGHGPILLRRAAGGIESIASQMLPLGVTADSSADESWRGQLAVGDALLLVSDGLTETFNPRREQWGVTGLRGSLEIHRDLNDMKLLDAIDGASLAFAAGEPLEDDRTLVLANYRS